VNVEHRIAVGQGRLVEQAGEERYAVQVDAVAGGKDDVVDQRCWRRCRGSRAARRN
jgi:hypothetical protein